MKKLIYVIFLFALFSCGSTKYIDVPVEVVKIQKEFEIKEVHDSVYLKDSTVINKVSDTVFITKWRTEYKERLRKDTIHIKDSIDRPVYLTKTEVVKDHTLYWWEKVLNALGAVMVLLITLFVGFKLQKFI